MIKEDDVLLTREEITQALNGLIASKAIVKKAEQAIAQAQLKKVVEVLAAKNLWRKKQGVLLITTKDWQALKDIAGLK